MKLLIINGPNINMLGTREVDIYGDKTYKDLINYLKNIAKLHKIKIKVFQSNHEGEIIDKIQKAKKYDGLIINPGAYTHYSHAIADAIRAIKVNSVEVHLTDINAREDFRKHSVISDACVGTFMGKGFESYYLGIKYLIGV